MKDMEKAGADLKDKWCVVTGGSSGIGLAYARELARRGASLVLISENGPQLEQARDSLRREMPRERKTPVLTLTLDLGKPGAASEVAAFLDREWIEPYVFINNAGIFSFRPVCETSVPRTSLFISLHVTAVTELSQIMARRMAESGQKGYLLNMSSMSCWTPMPGIALYAATKAYIRVFTRALGYEMRDSGVKVMVCCPGGISTDLFGLPPSLKKLALRLHAIDTPESFVRKALRRLFKGRSQYINGFMNRLGIFFVGIAPARVRMMVKHRMLDRDIRR